MGDLLESKTVKMFDGRTFEALNYVENDAFSNEVTVRIFADDCKEVKVIYNDEFGAYETIVVTNDDKKVPVCL